MCKEGGSLKEGLPQSLQYIVEYGQKGKRKLHYVSKFNYKKPTSFEGHTIMHLAKSKKSALPKVVQPQNF